MVFSVTSIIPLPSITWLVEQSKAVKCPLLCQNMSSMSKYMDLVKLWRISNKVKPQRCFAKTLFTSGKKGYMSYNNLYSTRLLLLYWGSYKFLMALPIIPKEQGWWIRAFFSSVADVVNRAYPMTSHPSSDRPTVRLALTVFQIR